MSALSHIDTIRSIVAEEKRAHDAKLEQANARIAQLQTEVSDKNATIARLSEDVAGKKRTLDLFGESADEQTIKRAKDAFELVRQVGGVDAIRVLVAERDRAQREQAEREAAAKAAKDAADQAAARAAAQAAARAAAKAAAKANRMSIDEARKTYETMLSKSQFSAGQLCVVAWGSSVHSIVEVMGEPNLLAPNDINTRLVVCFGQAAYFNFSEHNASRYMTILTPDNIVEVQQRVFAPANIKKLYEIDRATLERLKSSVPDIQVYASRVLIQTRNAIAKHPSFAGFVDIHSGKRPAAIAAFYKDMSDSQIDALARRESRPAARPAGRSATAAALMQLQASGSEDPPAGEASSSSDVKPEDTVAEKDATPNGDDSDECVEVGELTREERDRIGRANAIVLD